MSMNCCCGETPEGGVTFPMSGGDEGDADPGIIIGLVEGRMPEETKP